MIISVELVSADMIHFWALDETPFKYTALYFDIGRICLRRASNDSPNRGNYSQAIILVHIWQSLIDFLVCSWPQSFSLRDIIKMSKGK